MVIWSFPFRYSVEAGMHTERMPDGLALIIPMLQERHAGNYTCTAKYANTEELSKSVLIKTFGESMAARQYHRFTLEVAVTSLCESASQNTQLTEHLCLLVWNFLLKSWFIFSVTFMTFQLKSKYNISDIIWTKTIYIQPEM